MRSVFALLLLGGCNLAPQTTTGGADLPDRGACPRGLAVVSSDYASTEIAILAPSGEVVSPAFASSASSRASGLAAPLSGDVEVSFGASRPNELVLIDRQGTNVLTFIDVVTARVRAQLPIGTGFESNPQDYLELDEHRAVVPRLGENTRAGRQAHDAGSDLLLVDPSGPSIDDSLPMPRVPGYLPNPVAVRLLQGNVVVSLHQARADFQELADAEIAAFSAVDQRLSYRLTLKGYSNCGAVEAAPSGELWAIACTGALDRKGAPLTPEASGLVLLDPSTRPPTERRRFAALELAQEPIQSGIAFVSEHQVLLKTQTALGSDGDNRLLSLNLETGQVRQLASAVRRDGALGYGVALGGMTCGPECGDPCLVADASRGELLRFDVTGDDLVPRAAVRLTGAGLPPVSITPFW